MRIEILETIKEGRDEFTKDDVRTVPDELGAYFCSNGWARDLTGQTPTTERNTDDAVVIANTPSHSAEVGDANG